MNGYVLALGAAKGQIAVLPGGKRSRRRHPYRWAANGEGSREIWRHAAEFKGLAAEVIGVVLHPQLIGPHCRQGLGIHEEELSRRRVVNRTIFLEAAGGRDQLHGCTRIGD